MRMISEEELRRVLDGVVDSLVFDYPPPPPEITEAWNRGRQWVKRELLTRLDLDPERDRNGHLRNP